MDHASLVDADPPAWTSTYNDHDGPGVPAEPTPRIGIQELEPAPGSLTARWDVALDLNRVTYVAYIQNRPFDFAADPHLEHAERRVLAPHVGAGYMGGVGPARFPYEADLTDLTPGVTYYVVIRAVDDSPAHNEDDNDRALSAVPLRP
jgi:hypothetical protein